MQKTGILVMVVVSIVAVGILLSFYGNQIVFEDLAKTVGKISYGNPLHISSEITSETSSGIYAVEIIDFEKGITVTAKIIDPFNSMIESEEISVERFEEKFTITDSGTYQLSLETTTEKEIQVFGVIGPEPDAGKKSVGFISFYLLIIGLIGMTIVAIYAIKNRRK